MVSFESLGYMLHNIVWQAYQHAVTTFFPYFCAFCRVAIGDAAVFCSQCYTLIQPVTSSKVSLNAQNVLTVFAVSSYSSPLKELILAKSYRNDHASRQLAELMVTMTPIHTMTFDIIVPIPLHWSRYYWRGYNQAAVMAAVIAQRMQSNMIPLLKRNKRTPFLSSLTGKERPHILKDAFCLNDRYNAKDLVGKRILLVDDLLTTGSTLIHAAKHLLELRPASVHAVVACRTI